MKHKLVIAKKRSRKEKVEEEKCDATEIVTDICMKRKKILTPVVNIIAADLLNSETTDKEIKMGITVKKLRNKKIERNKHNTISTMAQEALKRGGGRACKATHRNGCRHFGLLDLKEMDSKTFMHYCKFGNWLND